MLGISDRLQAWYDSVRAQEGAMTKEETLERARHDPAAPNASEAELDAAIDDLDGTEEDEWEY